MRESKGKGEEAIGRKSMRKISGLEKTRVMDKNKTKK